MLFRLFLVSVASVLLVVAIMGIAFTPPAPAARVSRPVPDVAGAVKDCERRLGWVGETRAATMTDIKLMALCMHPFLKEHGLLK